MKPQSALVVVAFAFSLIPAVDRDAVAVPLIVHESTESFFESGGTFVTDCFGLGCIDVDFAIGPISGNVQWTVLDKLHHDLDVSQSLFSYVVFNDTFASPITEFRIANSGVLGAGLAPTGWSFTQDINFWQWQTFDPAFAVQPGLFADGFGVNLDQLVGVGFNPALVGLATGETLSSPNWRASAPVPEPASWALLSLAIGLALPRRKGRWR